MKEAAEILGISQLLDRKPKQLSGGQRQRVAVGRAIVREPTVFLFDEPLSNLDAKLRVQTRAEISKLHQRLGTTFIYVTHDQIEAMTMATPHRGDEGRPPAADRHAAEAVRSSGQRVRGRLHRQPVHELLRRARWSSRTASCSSMAAAFKLQVPENKQADLPAAARARRSSSASGPRTSTRTQYAPPGIIPAPLQGDVDVTELMGNEIFLYLLTGKKPFIARVDPRTHARAGEEIDLIVNMDNMHLFDPQTEKTLDVVAA